jgi:predicted permease
LRQSPGTTAVAVLILACGVGGNTTIFTIADAIFLDPPPLISNPEELVRLDASVAEFGYYDFEFYREHGSAFQDIMAYGGFPGTRGRNPRNGGEVAVGEGNDRVQASAWVVSNNYFTVLGVPLLRGAGFTGIVGEPQLDRPELVISHGFWTRQFGGDPSVTERPLFLNGVPFRLVGIAPREFKGVNPTHQVPDLYIPIMAAGAISRGFEGALERFSESGRPQASRFLQLVGRLEPSLTVEEAAPRMAILQDRWNAEFTDWATEVYGQGYQVNIRSQFHLTPWEARQARQMLTFLWFVVGAVFLIACTNLAILLIAKAAGREREMGIRAAIGAGRGRLLRQLLTESLILAAIGGALGILLAFMATDAAAATLPWSVAFELSPDITVVTFAVLLSSLAALLFGTAPAWMLSNVNVLEALQRPGQGRARAIFRGGLVAAQTALSIVLLVVGGLFAKSLNEARGVDLGFVPDNKLLLSVQLDNHGYSEEKGIEFVSNVLERVRSVPGVQGVTTANRMIFRPRNSWTFVVPGTDFAENGLWAGLNMVGPDYFEVLEIPIIAGRGIEASDRQSTQAVAVVNRTFAEQMWPDRNPVGQNLPLADHNFTVVGIAETSTYWRLGENPVPFVYFAHTQLFSGRMTFHVATGPDPVTLAGPVESAMREFDPNLAIAVNTLDALRDDQLSTLRVWTVFAGLFSGIALFLAMVGLYGVQSSLVVRRTREIGIRMALGARARTVILRVVVASLVMVGVGAIVGVGLALGFGGILQGFLFGVTPQDASIYLTVTLTMLIASVAASVLPAVRASRVSPVEALAQE